MKKITLLLSLLVFTLSGFEKKKEKKKKLENGLYIEMTRTKGVILFDINLSSIVLVLKLSQARDSPKLIPSLSIREGTLDCKSHRYPMFITTLTYSLAKNFGNFLLNSHWLVPN